MDAGRIYENDLANLWRTTPGALADRRCAGWLISDSSTFTDDPPHWYSASSIDAIHREGLGLRLQARGDEIPDVRTLLDYERRHTTPALLVVDEVMKILDTSRDKLYRDTRAGNILGFKTPGGAKLLYPAALIHPPVAVKLTSMGVTEQLLGIGSTAIFELRNTDPPELVGAHSKTGEIVIDDQSIDDFLLRHLEKNQRGHPYLSPAEWRALREQHRYDELLTLQAIKAEFRVHGRAIREATASGALPCLRTVGGQARIPRHAVEKWHAARKR